MCHSLLFVDEVKTPLFALLLSLSPLIVSDQPPRFAEASTLRTSLVLLFALSIPIGRIQDLVGPGIRLVESLSPTPNGDQDANRERLWPEFSGLVEALADPAVYWSGFRQFALPTVIAVTASTLSRSGDNEEDDAAKDQALALLERLNRLDQLGHLRTAAASPNLTRWNKAVSAEIGRRLQRLIVLLEEHNGKASFPSSSELEPLLPALDLVTLPQTSASDHYPEQLVKLISVLLASGPLADARSAEAIYNEQTINPTLLLGAALTGLAILEERNAGSAASLGGSLLTQGNTVQRVIETCSWHRNVLSGLARLTNASKGKKQKTQLPSLTDLGSHLENAVMSGDQMIRLASLELLALVDSASQTENGNSDETLLEKVVDVEKTPLTVQNVRDRNVRMRSVGRELARLAGQYRKDSGGDALRDERDRLVVRYIVGSFKINLMPIWGESIKALVDVVGSGNVQVAERVFLTAFAEIEGGRQIAEAERSDVPSTWRTAADEVNEDGEDEGEPAEQQNKSARSQTDEEDMQAVDNDRQFADPMLANRRTAIRVCIGNARSSRGAAGTTAASARTVSTTIAGAISRQKPDARLDLLNYRAQILSLFGEIAGTVERHNAKFVDVFLRDAGPRNFAGVMMTPLDEDQDEDEADGEKLTLEDAPADVTLQLGRRDRQTQLCSYLKVFAKMKNARALSRSDELHAYFMSLCSSPELTVQKLALDAILTWKADAVMPYVSQLRQLLDTSRFRDTLTNFDVSAESEVIQEGHRAGLMPLLIRLLFGQMISRRGSRTTGQGQSARKSAILSAISDCRPEEFGTLIELMLAPLGDQRPSPDGDNPFDFTPQSPVASLKRQNGFLSLLGDMLKYIGVSTMPFWPQLVGVTLNLTYHAQKAIVSLTDSITTDRAEGDGDANRSLSSATSPLRAVRQAGYKRISDFFRKPTTVEDFDWALYMPKMFEHLISPRLHALRVESTQSPSALMELFHVWSARGETIRLLAIHDDQVMPNIFAVFASPSVKPATIARILDIVERTLAFGQTEASSEEGAASVMHRCSSTAIPNMTIQDLLIKPHVSTFLHCITPLVQRASGDSKAADAVSAREELVKREIALLSAVAPFVTSSTDASHLVTLLHPLLKKGPHLVSERTKADLLLIFRHLLLLTPEFRDPQSQIFHSTYELFSSLFASLRVKDSRLKLVGAFEQFADVDPGLERVCKLIGELDSYSKKRMGEPDFDRRLNAFDLINADDTVIVAREWQPLVNTMLFFIQDHEELAIRTNASAVLIKFVRATAATIHSSSSDAAYLEALFLDAVWPGLKKCLRSKHELVRREVLSVFSIAVEQLESLAVLEDMRGLLFGGDQEANFFNNIHHIQVHRRLRAIRRLGEEADSGSLRSKTIADVLAPLLGTFLSKSTSDVTDHNLMNEAIISLGKLARQMKWGAYNGLLWYYLKLANQRTAEEKVYVRTATSILDAFHFAMEEKVDVNEAIASVEAVEAGADADAIVPDEAPAAEQKPRETGAPLTTIVEAVTGKLLPALMRYLEQKDETEDAVRLPVAVGVVRVVQCLPEQIKEVHISKLLRTLANVFKSKSQVTRDLAREALGRVMQALGQSYLPEVLRELRRALTRGPQLAVLAFTIHTLLVNWMAAETDPIVSLSQGVKDIVEVSVEDIFGMTAEDRESIGSKTSFKEVRHTKSIDTFEQVSKVVVPHKMADVLQPLRDILQQTEVTKSVRQVEECLRRIASGVSNNPQFDSDKFLVLCATLIRRDAVFLQPRKAEKVVARGGSATNINYAVLLKRKDVEEASVSGRDHYSRNAHKFVVFGLELLSTALRRSRFDFQEQQVLAKLNTLVEIVGETMYASETAVLEVSLRTVAGIVRCPVSNVDKALPIFIKQIFSVIQTSGSVQSSTVQTALRTLASILRDCRQSTLKDNQVAMLLKMIEPDLEETHEQGVLFSLLRAIVARRFVVPEVYDVMERVAEMLVTNQSGQVRELCRATYLQFLLDYPQGKERLNKQLGFLAKNMSYVHESGRLSVLEITSAVFDKFGEDILREHAETFFLALAMVLANDDSAKCREKGAGLIKAVFASMGDEQRVRTLQMVHTWASQSERAELSRIGIQIYGLLLSSSDDQIPAALELVSRVLSECADDLESVEEDPEADAQSQLDWRLPYQALQTLSRLDPAHAPATDAVRRLLLFPHKWVRAAASRILGTLYGSTQAVSPEIVAAKEAPLTSFPALVDAAKKLTIQLQSEALDDDLALQAVKNLVWIGSCFALYQAEEEAADESGNGNEDEDEAEAAATLDTPARIAADPLAWLIRRLSHATRHSPTPLHHASVLRLFAALSSSLPCERVVPLLPFILRPLSDDALSLEVQTILQGIVGTSAFATAWSAHQTRVADKRRERKQERLMLAIQDPEKAGRKKAKENQRKHESRKRKNARFAAGKGKERPAKRLKDE